MDPSKRICLKHLPEGCTKREIAELIRNRTGTPIHSIDLGLDDEGHTRRYAHFSCEGAKHVLEVLRAGVVLRDCTVFAHPAKEHYSFRYAEARRKRERQEAEEKEQLETYWAAAKQRFLDRTNGGELPKNKAPKNFYASKRKYARIAAEIAQASRSMHSAGSGGTGNAEHPLGAAHPLSYPAHEEASPHHSPAPSSPIHAPTEGVAKGAGGSRAPAKRAHRTPAARPKATPATAPAAAAPPPPPPPPEPTKEERKLTGLHAKLAALKEKLKK